MRVIFFGTDEFSLGTLNALNDIRLNNGTVTHLDVVSSGKPVRKYGKYHVPCVISYANTHGLNLLSWDKVKEEKKFETQYDLGVVASFGDFIPGKLISTISKGAINIHPSLLPRWRGAAPIIHTVLAGDTSTAISVIEVSKKQFDVGKILYQKEYEVSHLCTSDELLSYLSDKSSEIIPFVMNNIEELQKNAKVQDGLVTHAPKVKRSTGWINFTKHSISYVQRLQRALPLRIGVRASWNGQEVKLGTILNTKDILESPDHIPVGGCWYEKRTKLLWIKLIDGCISINTLQFETRKEIPALSFKNGYLINKQTGKPVTTKFVSISDNT